MRSLQEVGASGEQLALQHLQQQGLRLLLRNYRCKSGELDLVMLEGATLALIEVRLRHNARFGGAAASITPAKQRRIINAAKHLLLTHPDLARHRARFDVVAVDATEDQMKVEWIRDAFRM